MEGEEEEGGGREKRISYFPPFWVRITSGRETLGRVRLDTFSVHPIGVVLSHLLSSSSFCVLQTRKDVSTVHGRSHEQRTQTMDLTH